MDHTLRKHTSSKSEQKSPSDFDVLHKQDERSDVEYHIPIRKIRFEDLPKPTDIKLEKKEVKNSESEEDNKFSVPKSILDYLDEMIVRRKLPLRSLKFDIGFAKSMDEIAKYLSATNMSEKDREKLLSLIGYEKSKYITPEDTILRDKKNAEKLLKLDGSLKEVRNDYVEELIPYLKKIENDKKSFSQLIGNFGVEKEMPQKDEPKELMLARKEYFKVKKEKGELSEDFRDFVLSEAGIFKQEIINKLSGDKQVTIEKGLKQWDKMAKDESGNVGLALMGDLNLLSQTKDTYEGLRARDNNPLPKDEIKIEVPVSISPVEKNEEIPNKTGDVYEEGVFTLDFKIKNKIKKIEIIFGGKEHENAVKILLDGVEIGKGFMTEKGPSIGLYNNFKAGWFLSKTEEELAFNEAVKKIKSF